MEDVYMHKIFSFMGYSISYINNDMFFGYADCAPLGKIIQINSSFPMNEEDINFHLKIFRSNYPELP